MSKKRVSGPERRTLILNAARHVFARHGFDGAKTMQIAQEAEVSEALIYRHFPSKRALYRAVLRQIFREQDENWAVLDTQEPGAAAIVRSQRAYFRGIIVERPPKVLASFRLTLASLTGDGYFASIIYRRSQRHNLRAVEKAVEVARAAGEIEGRPCHIGGTTMFTEHVGTMLSAVYGLDASRRPYGLEGEELVREAVRFCCRGIGMADTVIERHLAD